MTRAAHRILNRARSDAWRRVGIPMSWKSPQPAEDKESGKNVAGDTASDAGTGRSEPDKPSVTNDRDDR
jgi:hypothetical protein